MGMTSFVSFSWQMKMNKHFFLECDYMVYALDNRKENGQRTRLNSSVPSRFPFAYRRTNPVAKKEKFVLSLCVGVSVITRIISS